MLVEEFHFDVNAEGDYGSTAWQIAAADGWPEILQYLLNRPECLWKDRLETALCSAAREMNHTLN